MNQILYTYTLRHTSPMAFFWFPSSVRATLFSHLSDAVSLLPSRNHQQPAEDTEIRYLGDAGKVCVCVCVRESESAGMKHCHGWNLGG